MRKLILLLILVFICNVSYAATNTTYLELRRGDLGESNWHNIINFNAVTIDTAVGLGHNADGTHKSDIITGDAIIGQLESSKVNLINAITDDCLVGQISSTKINLINGITEDCIAGQLTSTKINLISGITDDCIVGQLSGSKVNLINIITDDCITSTAHITGSKLNLVNTITDDSIVGQLSSSKINLIGGITDDCIIGQLSGAKVNVVDLITNDSLTAAADIATTKIAWGTINQGDIYYDNGSAAITRLIPSSSGYMLVTSGDSANPAWSASPVAINVIFDNGTTVIANETSADVYVPYDMRLKSVTILGHQSGDLEFDIWKDTYANYPPTVADTIIVGSYPAISDDVKFQNLAIGAWTTSISEDSILRIVVNSADILTQGTLILKAVRL